MRKTSVQPTPRKRRQGVRRQMAAIIDTAVHDAFKKAVTVAADGGDFGCTRCPPCWMPLRNAGVRTTFAPPVWRGELQEFDF